MDAVCDIVISIVRGMQIGGNHVAVAIKSVISGIANATPCDGDISFVYYGVDVGGRIDARRFGIAIEYGTVIYVVCSAIWNFRVAPLWV